MNIPAVNSGTVTTVSVVSANGFGGSVANPSTTPAVTVTTSVNGLLKGDGTGVAAAVAGTDYLTPTGNGSGLTGLTGSQITGDIGGNAASITGSVAESQVTGLTSDLAARATDTLVVHLAGAETVSGAKTFSSTITAAGGALVTGGTNASAEVQFGSAATSVALSTLAATVSGMRFDHRGASNLGTWSWSNGTNAGTLRMKLDANGNLKTTGGLGVFGTTPVNTKPTLTGTQGFGSAQAGLIAALAGYGLFTDSTTPPGFADLPVPALVTALDGATVTFDLSVSNLYQVTLGGNRTLALSNDTARPFTLILNQDATGSRTVTWFSGIRWPGGTAPTLTTTASKSDVFTFMKLSAGNYLGFQTGAGL